MTSPSGAGDSSRSPTDAQLELVAEHGSGTLERALAAVLLAKRRDRLDEVRQIMREQAGADRPAEEFER